MSVCNNIALSSQATHLLVQIHGVVSASTEMQIQRRNITHRYMINSEQYFQIDPLTAPAVLDAFKHYADGASMREITDEMNLKGVRTKRGGKISINSVTRMLHNRKYIGEYRYNDIVHPNGIPAIDPEDLFNRVHERMAANKKAPAKLDNFTLSIPHIHSCSLHNYSKSGILQLKSYLTYTILNEKLEIKSARMSVLFFDLFFRLSGYVKLFSFKHVFYQLNSTIFVPICNTISYSIKAPLLMCNLHQEGYIILLTTKNVTYQHTSDIY